MTKGKFLRSINEVFQTAKQCECGKTPEAWDPDYLEALRKAVRRCVQQFDADQIKGITRLERLPD